MRLESVDMTAQNIEKIGELFPNCVTEMLDEEKSTPEKAVSYTHLTLPTN